MSSLLTDLIYDTVEKVNEKNTFTSHAKQTTFEVVFVFELD